jgi:hypothetical protein
MPSRSSDAMIKRSLVRKLERLEERVVPANLEPEFIYLQYVNPDGTVDRTDRFEIKPSALDRAWLKKTGRR